MAIAITNPQRAFATILVAALLLALLITIPAAAYTVRDGSEADQAVIADTFSRIPEPVYSVVDQATILIEPDLPGRPDSTFAYVYFGFEPGVIHTRPPSSHPLGGAFIAHELAHVLDRMTHWMTDATRPQAKEAWADSFAAYLYPEYKGAYGYPLLPEEAWAWAVDAVGFEEAVTAALDPTMPWPDLPPGAEYQAAGAWAFDTGVFLGRGNGLLDPNAPITRGEMLLVLYRLEEATR